VSHSHCATHDPHDSREAPLSRGGAARSRRFARGVAALIEPYRRLISPLLPPSCRFEPSCSRYAQDALRRHGFRRGARLAVGRVLRCGPWSSGGFDPVP
jgi:hypothetical protein